MGEELKSLTLADLHELAKQKGLKGISKLNKEELIKAIMDNHNDNSKKSEETIVEKAPNGPDESVPVEGVLEVLPDGFGFFER